MYAAERLAKIKRILVEKKRIDVGTLSRMLNVSEVTVRRDLVKLEEQGYLVKTYGGAILQELVDDDKLPSDAESDDYDPYLADKELLAAIAANFVKDGDTVFLGPGSTCFQIARRIGAKKNIHVVTSNLSIVNLFRFTPLAKLITVGGEYNSASNSLVGQLAVDNIERLHTNVGFVSVDGITIDRGYTVNDLSHLPILKAAKNNCDQMVLVADHSKFGKMGMSTLGDLTLFENVVTNYQIPEKFKSQFFDNCVRVYTSVDIGA